MNQCRVAGYANRFHIRRRGAGFLKRRPEPVQKLRTNTGTQRLRLPGNTVANLFFGVRVKWQHLLENNAESAPFQRYEFWYQWVDWIAGLRRTLRCV